MSQKQKAKVIPPSEIPEVMRFLEAADRLDRLRAAHPEVFAELDNVKEEYNTALEAAEKIVRAKEVSCGPFDLYQTQTKYDADKLYEEVGRDFFFAFGGTEKTITTYELDRAKFEAHIAANKLRDEVVDKVRTVSPRFKKPEKINI